MSKGFSSSPQYWRIAAEEARTQTEVSDDPQERKVLRRIADDYDWLAQHAAERLTAAFDDFGRRG